MAPPSTITFTTSSANKDKHQMKRVRGEEPNSAKDESSEKPNSAKEENEGSKSTNRFTVFSEIGEGVRGALGGSTIGFLP